MIKIKNKLNLLVKILNSFNNTEPLLHGKIVTMSYLTVAVEAIFQDIECKDVKKKIINIVNDAISIFNSFTVLSRFKSKNNSRSIASSLNKNFISMHKNLWQEIWPEHSFKE